MSYILILMSFQTIYSINYGGFLDKFTMVKYICQYEYIYTDCICILYIYMYIYIYIYIREKRIMLAILTNIRKYLRVIVL